MKTEQTNITILVKASLHSFSSFNAWLQLLSVTVHLSPFTLRFLLSAYVVGRRGVLALARALCPCLRKKNTGEAQVEMHVVPQAKENGHVEPNKPISVAVQQDNQASTPLPAPAVVSEITTAPRDNAAGEIE